MTMIIIASVCLNILLAVLLFRRMPLYYNTVRFWFMRKPDMDKVEKTVREIVARPEFTPWFEFKEFLVHDPWMADLDLFHTEKNIPKHWQEVVDDLTGQISHATDLPCWPYKILYDPGDHSRTIGSGLGIGHSRILHQRVKKKKKTAT